MTPEEILYLLERGIPDRVTLVYVQSALFQMPAEKRHALKELAEKMIGVDATALVFGVV